MLVSGDLLLILYTHRKGESLSLRFRKSEAFFCRSLIGRSVSRVMCSVKRYLRLRYFGIAFRFYPLDVPSYAFGIKAKIYSQNLFALPLTEGPDCYFANKAVRQHNPPLFVSKIVYSVQGEHLKMFTSRIKPRLYILTSVRVLIVRVSQQRSLFCLNIAFNRLVYYLIVRVCVVAKPFLFIYTFSKFGLAIQPIILNHFK